MFNIDETSTGLISTTSPTMNGSRTPDMDTTLVTGPLSRTSAMNRASTLSFSDSGKVSFSTAGRVRMEPRDEYTPRSHSPHDIYSTRANDKAFTQANMSSLHRGRPERDLAMFFRTTSPPREDGMSRKTERPRGPVSASKSAFRFFRRGSKKLPANPVTQAHNELNIVLRDEGKLLLPNSVEQKVSLTGKRYLAMTQSNSHADQMSKKMKNDLEDRFGRDHSTSQQQDRPGIANVLTNDAPTADKFEWYLKYCGGRSSPVSPLSIDRENTLAGAEQENTEARQDFDLSPAPIRPAASNPPSPPPDRSSLIAENYRNGLTQHPTNGSTDMDGTSRRKPTEIVRKAVIPHLHLALPKEEFPVSIPRHECEIKHPTPTREFASHPLLTRRSSLVDSAQSRSATDSPGPPPPKSPLRPLRSDYYTHTVLHPEDEDQVQKQQPPRLAPTIQSAEEFGIRNAAIIPTVTTECTGPLSRTISKPRAPVKHMLYPPSKKEREERIKIRKMRDRPNSVIQSIDTVVSVQPPQASPRQRLRKQRPDSATSQGSDLKPAPLSTRAATRSSSLASWEKVSKLVTRSVSPALTKTRVEDTKQHSRGPSVEMTVSTPVSPTGTNNSLSLDGKACLDAVMLVAEEIPIPSAKSPFRPAKIVVAKERVYTPRPRSASMPRNGGKRRSRNSVAMPSRVLTPEMPGNHSDTPPPLPSPPPNRALPPTPPASGSERVGKRSGKAPPIPPKVGQSSLAGGIWQPQSMLGRSRHCIPRLATQDIQSTTTHDAEEVARLRARNMYLEKQNRILDAALRAVLKTNGEFESAHTSLLDYESPRSTMTWEERVSRRSEAGHAASSSNGSALEMYMSARRGSRAGA